LAGRVLIHPVAGKENRRILADLFGLPAASIFPAYHRQEIRSRNQGNESCDSDGFLNAASGHPADGCTHRPQAEILCRIPVAEGQGFGSLAESHPGGGPARPMKS
jgi:hypothetical protein